LIPKRLQPHAPPLVQHGRSKPLQLALGHVLLSHEVLVHLLLVHIAPDEQVMGQVSVFPQPSGFMPHSVLLHTAGLQAPQ
jgi:hypothetical protein